VVGPGFKSGREAVRAVSGVFDSHTSPPNFVYFHMVARDGLFAESFL